ncbi:MAG: endolytic transglycosylase MltG [Thermoanaerobaculia bacterium]
MNRWWWRLLLLAVLAVAAAAGGAAWRIDRWLTQPYGDFPEEQIVTVRPGQSGISILEQLESVGVLENARWTRAYLVYRLGDPPLQAGEYRFDQPSTPPQVLDKLTRGRVVTYPATLIEGLTMDESAQALAAQGFGDVDKFRFEMGRHELIADLDPLAEDLEGYLHPETYHFAGETSEAEIVAKLVDTFKRRYRDRIAAPNRTVRELTTFASIVEKEALLDEERPLIAGVFANRLRIGMALGADPTVIFALKQQGTWDGNIRRRDLALDSPYNTYVYPGLPPGPICSPGIASLEAAAAPTETAQLYFVSRNDGTHIFATNLRDHNRNVDKWQKQYWRRRWAEERRGARE